MICLRRVPCPCLWCLLCARSDYYRSILSRETPYSPPMIPASQLTVFFPCLHGLPDDGRQQRGKRELCRKPENLAMGEAKVLW